VTARVALPSAADGRIEVSTVRAAGRPGRPAAPSRRRVPRGYESVDSILLTEPRIEAIRRELQAILDLVQLEAGGQPVEVDGFRLRDIEPFADYPTTLSDIFWHLSSVCNFSCEFCYEKGNPADLPIQNMPRMATHEEIVTRLKHYNPATGRGVFSVRSAINEPFANPHAIEYLRLMREKAPHELISFVTNGSYLTEDTVRALADLQPLFFNLSIYSVDPEVRRVVLRDRKGDTAVRAVELLARYEVPYMTNLVMWPSIPFSDLQRTIEYVARHRAAVVRVCLGGNSRYLPGDWTDFRIDDYWPKVVDEVERIRDRYPIPVLIEPNSYVRRDTEALVDDVVIDSPAGRAGIRRGDRVVAVDGRRVGSRMQLISELRRSSRSVFRPPGVVGMTAEVRAARPESVRLTVRRGDTEAVYHLDRYEPAAMCTYPYGKIAAFDDFVLGLIITDTLRYSSLLAARRILERRRARRCLLLTSPLIEPILHHMIDKTDPFAGFELHVRVAENRYFGGNINIGDLLVVEDYVHAVRGFVQDTGLRPDLVLIPASPFATSPWRRDLTGRPWTDIERLTRLPVETVPCSPLVF
jgi:NifB/MoaA-like Fe-S oxidoreductase